jgi:GAF domain-containing protein
LCSQCTICAIVLVDISRLWYKSRVGISITEKHRNGSFDAYTVLGAEAELFIVEDATVDPKFAENSFVINHPFIKFYAGTPLVVNGCNVGSFCIMDTKTREFDQSSQNKLIKMAKMISNIMAQRRDRFLFEMELTAGQHVSAQMVDASLRAVSISR